MNGAHARRLPDGRLHLQHGPIDCIVQAWGERGEVEAAYLQAADAFQDILPTLVAELPALRAPLGAAHPMVGGPVARRMVQACLPHRGVFLTPMIAVAGAVADELLAALLRGRHLARACVNDGGDIALHLEDGEHFDVGIAFDPNGRHLDGRLRIGAGDAARGVATSGWRGRSQSLGIADAVTVLAASGAAADVAATLIANAVNIDHPGIRRLPARDVKEDSDLGELPVTVEVPTLPPAEVDAALARGHALAVAMRAAGLIEDAFLTLQGRHRAVREAHAEAQGALRSGALPNHPTPPPAAAFSPTIPLQGKHA